MKTTPSSKLGPRYHIAVKLSGDTWTAPDLAGGFTSKRELVSSDIAQRIVKQAKEHKQEVIIMRSSYHSPLVTPEDWGEGDDDHC